MKPRPSFDPKSFLTKVGEGRSIGWYDRNSWNERMPRDGRGQIRLKGRQATVTTEPSMNAMLEPRIVAANTQGRGRARRSRRFRCGADDVLIADGCLVARFAKPRGQKQILPRGPKIRPARMR
jgi:hypothetical protein